MPGNSCPVLLFGGNAFRCQHFVCIFRCIKCFSSNFKMTQVHIPRQVSSKSARRGDGALVRPEAGNGPTEEEADGAGGETNGQDPGAGKVENNSHT